MNKTLILCTGNSCRSQMAEGWFRFFFPSIEVYSAGTFPEPVNRYAIQVMKERGIDISKYHSNNVDEYINDDFDFVITVCDNAKEKCPYFFTSAVRIHYSLIDPAKAMGDDQEKLLVYRKIRDQIEEHIKGMSSALQISNN